MDENPYKAPLEKSKLVERQESEPLVAEWQRLSLAILIFGATDLMLALTGNEKQLIWLSHMMIATACVSALSLVCEIDG